MLTAEEQKESLEHSRETKKKTESFNEARLERYLDDDIILHFWEMVY